MSQTIPKVTLVLFQSPNVKYIFSNGGFCLVQSSLDHQMDWICYENSFYVFWLLEQLSADVDVEQELITQLETGAFSLSDEFPLFSLYMWRIGGLYRTTGVRPDETQCS